MIRKPTPWLRLKSRSREIKAYWWYLTKRIRTLPDVKMAIISRPRSGSKLLRTLLDSHPDFFCDGEILLNHYGVINTRMYIEGHAAIANTRGYGCKLFLRHLEQPRVHLLEILETMANDGWRFIYLERRNLLRQSLSAIIAHERGIAHETMNDALKDFKITINPRQLAFMTMGGVKICQDETRLMSYIPHLHLVYEDDLLNADMHQHTADRVFEYLDFPLAAVHTENKKIVPQDLRMVLANYDQIVDYLEPSKLSHYLNEP